MPHNRPPAPPTAWVTGAGGLLGSHLIALAPQFFSNYHIIGLTRPELELTDFPAVEARYAKDKPELVVHCAALSRSPVCQAQPALARKLNVDITRFLAGLAADIPFFFFSSDLVFDGLAGNYDENAPVHPLSVYAETKVAAEALVLGNPKHTVIRTSLNAGRSPTGDRGCDEQMRQAWARGESMKLFVDEFRSPIPAAATAKAVWQLARRSVTGLFHVAGSERLSRWRMGELLAARHPELQPRLVQASLKDYDGAPRPPDTSLNCAKAQSLLDFPLPRFSDWAFNHAC